MLNIDFETYSECDIRTSGAYKYSLHPSTEILCLGYCFEDRKVKLWTPDQEFPEAILSHIEKGGLIGAFNAFFEMSIWENVGEEKLNWPHISLSQWRCSQALASSYALPRSLAKAANALNLQQQKDMCGHRTMLKLSQPRKPSKNNSSTRFIPETSKEDFDKLYSYCEDDVRTEKAVQDCLVPLSKYETKIWALTQYINKYGVHIDVTLINNILEFISETEHRLNVETNYITNGEIDRVSRREAVLKFAQARGVDIQGYTKADISECLKRDDLPDVVRRLLEIRQILGLTSTAKYKAFLEYACFDEPKICGLLNYHAATTGRFASNGVQLQNLPRSVLSEDELAECIDLLNAKKFNEIISKYKNPFSVISSTIRACIIPRPGYKMIVSDYASIETRVLFWLAKEEKGLALLRDNKDIYIDMAATIFGIDPKNITKDQRHLGKIAILGLGYGMGANKFKATCEGWGVEISEELANKTVKLYRQKYKSVIKLWSLLEDMAKKAIDKSINTYSAYGIEFKRTLQFTYCKLPSKRKLCYPYMTLKENDMGAYKSMQLSFKGINTFTKKFEDLFTYGGKLVENVVQAIARDMLVAAMLNIQNDDKYEILFTVHDEIVAETNHPDASLEDFNNLMCDLPEWADGCPVKAEGWIGDRYRK